MKLRLTITVEYTPNGETLDTLREYLSNIADYAYANGMVTGDTAAEVTSWHVEVHDITAPEGGR